VGVNQDAGSVPVLGTVSVVGLGLIGGSLARALAAGRETTGIEVVGWDLDPGTRASAQQAGIATVDDPLDAGRADLVVLAVPLRAMARMAAVLAPVLDPAATVTDVGSVKGPVRAAVEAAGLGDRYVGAHPMAGTERVGFAASDAALLRGAVWAVTTGAVPTGADGARPEGLEPHLGRVLALVEAVGGRPLLLTDDVHDRATALVSHVPHVAATALLSNLVDSDVRDVALALAAGSFRDGTRVGRTGPHRTQAMVEDNAGAVAAVVRSMAADLVSLADDLEAGRPTEWFFDRPDPVRRLLEEPAPTPPPAE